MLWPDFPISKFEWNYHVYFNLVCENRFKLWNWINFGILRFNEWNTKIMCANGNEKVNSCYVCYWKEHFVNMIISYQAEWMVHVYEPFETALCSIQTISNSFLWIRTTIKMWKLQFYFFISVNQLFLVAFKNNQMIRWYLNGYCIPIKLSNWHLSPDTTFSNLRWTEWLNQSFHFVWCL